MAQPLDVAFAAGASGAWRIDRIIPVSGDGLPPAQRLDIAEGAKPAAVDGARWVLRGVTSNTRYTTRREVTDLASK